MQRLKLTARAIKVTLVIEQSQFAGLAIPEGSPPVQFEITVDGRKVCGQLNSRTLRRALATAASGPAAFVVQGKLGAGDVLAEAGITAQPKVERPAP